MYDAATAGRIWAAVVSCCVDLALICGLGSSPQICLRLLADVHLPLLAHPSFAFAPRCAAALGPRLPPGWLCLHLSSPCWHACTTAQHAWCFRSSLLPTFGTGLKVVRWFNMHRLPHQAARPCKCQGTLRSWPACLAWLSSTRCHHPARCQHQPLRRELRLLRPRWPTSRLSIQAYLAGQAAPRSHLRSLALGSVTASAFRHPSVAAAAAAPQLLCMWLLHPHLPGQTASLMMSASCQTGARPHACRRSSTACALHTVSVATMPFADLLCFRGCCGTRT